MLLSNRSWKVPVAVLGASALLLSAGAAVEAVASSSTPSAKACISSKGYLGVASSKGTCAKGFRSVVINEQGPRGATGKPGAAGKPGKPGKPGANGVGATSAEFDQTSATIPTVRTIGTVNGDLFALGCSAREAYLYFDAATPVYLHGSGFSQGKTYSNRNAGPDTNGYLSIAQYVAGGFPATADFQAFTNGATAGYQSGHVLLLIGSTSATLDFSLYSDGARCQAQAQLTPSTTQTKIG